MIQPSRVFQFCPFVDIALILHLKMTFYILHISLLNQERDLIVGSLSKYSLLGLDKLLRGHFPHLLLTTQSVSTPTNSCLFESAQFGRRYLRSCV